MSLAVLSSQKHYARFGRCVNVKTGATRCAMSAEDCEPSRNEDGELWYNDLRLKQKGINDGDCKCENTLMGACVAIGGKRMDFECAPRTNQVEEDYCLPHEDENGNSINPDYQILPTNSAGTNCYCDKLHSIEDDAIRHDPNAMTKYGACYDDSNGEFFCAYSSDYCTDGHRWVSPKDVPDIRGDGGHCTCEQTHIGGCVGGMYPFHCALSETDCHWNGFVLPLELKSQHNHACMLCDMKISLDVKHDEINEIEYATEGLPLAALISIGVAAPLVAIGLYFAIRSCCRRNKASSAEDSSPENVPQIS